MTKSKPRPLRLVPRTDLAQVVGGASEPIKFVSKIDWPSVITKLDWPA